jgi:hypothetical protein
MARDFNGSSDQIAFTLNSNQTNLAQVTVAHWFYADATGQYRRAWQLAQSFPNDQLQCEMDDSFGWCWQARFSTTPGTWSMAKPSTGSWQHFCGTHDLSSSSNSPILYIDGASQSLTTRSAPSGTRSNTSTTFTIGRDTDGSQYWDGRLAEMAIWNRILNASEVAGLAKGLSPAFFPNGLVFYTPLIGRNSPETDIKGGVTGTLTGTSNIAHPRIIYPARLQNSIFPGAAAAAGQPTIKRIATVPFLGGSLRQRIF